MVRTRTTVRCVVCDVDAIAYCCICHDHVCEEHLEDFNVEPGLAVWEEGKTMYEHECNVCPKCWPDRKNHEDYDEEHWAWHDIKEWEKKWLQDSEEHDDMKSGHKMIVEPHHHKNIVANRNYKIEVSMRFRFKPVEAETQEEE